MNAADFPKHALVKLFELDGSVQQLVNRAVDLDGGIQNARRILFGNVPRIGRRRAGNAVRFDARRDGRTRDEGR
jgi:hypothetical protein